MATLTLPIVTPRLLLRDFAPDDLEAVRRYALDPRVLEHTLTELRSEHELTAHFTGVLNARTRHPRRAFELAVVVRRSDAVIGTCELARGVGATVELGYLLARRYWGRGYGTEVALALRDAAFNALRAERLRALIAVENERSRAVLVKAGLRWAALRRRHAHAKGRYWDCDEYELERRDWSAPGGAS